MLKNKLNILFVFLILIFSISAVSASENTTDIQTISESEDSAIEYSNDILQGESNTYSDLQDEVNKQTDELNINQDYNYNNDSDSDYINGITIVNKTDYTINGNGHIIDGSNQSRIFSITNSNLTINDLILINGLSSKGSGIVIQNSNVILNNVTFRNMESTRMGACSINNGTLTIIDSSFINTTARYGGAVYGVTSNIEINNCDFKDSEVRWGAIYFSNSQGIIENSRFWGCPIIIGFLNPPNFHLLLNPPLYLPQL